MIVFTTILGFFSFLLGTRVILLGQGILAGDKSSRSSMKRLIAMWDGEVEHQKKEDSVRPAIIFPSSSSLKHLSDSFGRAGFFTTEQRKHAKRLLVLIMVGALLVGAMAGLLSWGTSGIVVGIPCGLFFGSLACVGYLRYGEKEFERETIFQLPITLEAIIFLVESGLGVLPALSKIVSPENGIKQSSPVKQVLKVVYELTVYGMPFRQALQIVADTSKLRILRHVLLHLDMSATVGSELIPSLRSLSQHAVTEWRLCLERRVRRLENLVVFPVFTAVLGLGLLTAAVPIATLFQLSDTMNNQQQGVLVNQ